MPEAGSMNGEAPGVGASCRRRVKCQVTTAVARELVGFIWAIACEVMGRPHTTRAVS